MIFLMNTNGSRRWDEVDQEIVIQYLAGDTKTKAEEKALEKKLKEFFQTAKHGNHYFYKAQTILAVELKE